MRIVGKKQGSVTCKTDREEEVSKIILYLYCVSDELGNNFYP